MKDSLLNEIEREQLKEDRMRLVTQKEIKKVFRENYDRLHNEFVCENENLTHEEILLVKRVFDFLKDNA